MEGRDGGVARSASGAAHARRRGRHGDIAFRIAEMARSRGGEAEISSATSMPTCWARACAAHARSARRGVRGVRRCREASRSPTRAWTPIRSRSASGNVTHVQVALEEARRVLRPGGRFLCLEFSRVEAPGQDALYDAYSMNVLPRLGQMVAGRRRGLSLSRRKHPPLPAAARIRAHDREGGLVAREGPQPHRRYRRDAFGVADMKAGKKLPPPCGEVEMRSEAKHFGWGGGVGG